MKMRSSQLLGKSVAMRNFGIRQCYAHVSNILSCCITGRHLDPYWLLVLEINQFGFGKVKRGW